MNFSETCIRRPVFATILSLILILIGAYCYAKLEPRFFPKHPSYNVYITTNYPGASQQLVESAITTPLEQTLNTVAGINSIQSDSMRGMSMIQVELDPNANQNETITQLRDQVASQISLLPANITPPSIIAGGSPAELMDFFFVSSKRIASAVRDYLQRNLADKIQEIPGVSSPVSLYGANDYALRVWLNPIKMAAFNINVTDIQQAIDNANLSLPAGIIYSRTINFPLTANTLLTTPQEFNNIIIKSNTTSNSTQLIHLKDVAQAQIGEASNLPSLFGLDNQEGILLEVDYDWGTANPMAISQQVTALIAQAAPTLPNDIKMSLFFNKADWLTDAFHEVYVTIAFSILFVCLVVFLFIGDWRATLIPIATIPVCLISSFGILYAFGASLNMFTLLALSLSIGLIVDDAIVMLENIDRHAKNGLSAFQAAIVGSKEITFAVIAMTLTLVAVFAPIGFAQGEAAAIIQAFSLALVGTVLVSGFVALTLSPMMCSRLLRDHQENRYQKFLDRIYSRLEKIYRATLNFVLSIRALVLIMIVALATLGVLIFKSLPMEYLPKEDMGLAHIVITPPPGANFTIVKQQVERVKAAVQSIPEIEQIGYTTNGGNAGNMGRMFIKLKDFSLRHRTADQVAAEINARLPSLTGIQASSYPVFIGIDWDHGFAFDILSHGSYEELAEIAQQMVKKLQRYPGLLNLQTSMNFDSQQYDITINNARSDQLQVSRKDIDSALAGFLGGTNTVSKYIMDNKIYDIILQADTKYQNNITNLSNFYVRNAQGNMIPLSNLVHVKPVLTVANLAHYNLSRAATVYGQMAPGYSTGQVITDLQHILPELLPQDTKYAFVEAAKEYLQANSNMSMLFLAAIIFIYLVLGAQFESFVDPLAILLGVPLCIVAALAALKLTGGSINIYTEVGLITLVGLISKHGILIVQFANQLRQNGIAVREAVIQAATLRLRPILMTTSAMICGAIPLILASGANAISRQQLGWVICSGLFFGTFFSLIVVPVAYSLLATLKPAVKN
jgi:hydrophobe/amphiphile efflux-1 (HAE1) family protein